LRRKNRAAAAFRQKGVQLTESLQSKPRQGPSKEALDGLCCRCLRRLMIQGLLFDRQNSVFYRVLAWT
jgi:hypothetical protein